MTIFDFHFNNTFINLPQVLYSKTLPQTFKKPKIALLNSNLAAELGLNFQNTAKKELAHFFSGQTLENDKECIAMSYAGHQFGYFVILGDGRAHLIGEHLCPNGKRVDIQLKGSGKTPYSRGGDGLAALGPMLREYIISEAMHHLNIKTSRSLAVVLTGEKVLREKELNGAILTRVAKSHLRIGTFQYLAAKKDKQALNTLTHYAINRHYPKILEIESNQSSALLFLEKVMNEQIKLIIDWLRVGFIHGVMNTDNTTISGETIDYGPCAFMDSYHPGTVFSSIDKNGRYAYANQVQIIQWNLARLAESLIPLIHSDFEKALFLAKESINKFSDQFQKKWLKMMRKKLGLCNNKEKSENQALANEDLDLIGGLLDWMQKNPVDFTNTFRDLTLNRLDSNIYQNSDFKDWLRAYHKRKEKNEDNEKGAMLMKKMNPMVIARNHQVEKALNLAEKKLDFSLVHQLLEALKEPYKNHAKYESFQLPPTENEKVHQTFCGT